MAVSTPCPHCGAANPVGSAFCESCGKALPTSYAPGPRVVTAGTPGSSGVGRELLSDELRKKMNKSSGALLAVAIIWTVMGPVALWLEKEQMQRQNPGQVIEIYPIAYVIVFGIAAAFFGLWLWSRFQPFAAAIVGLVLFVSLWLLNIVVDPTQIYKGIIIKIIIVAVLVKAIQAGAEYRKLMAQQRPQPQRGFPVV
jgi:hypothetical protein